MVFGANTNTWRVGVVCTILAFAIAGCGRSNAGNDPQPPHVAVVVLKPQKVEITEDFPGRINALRVAEIRSQVSGIVQRRLFEQGAEVRAHQPLYQINAAPFRADTNAAAAALKRAQAELAKASEQAARMERLLKANATSIQSHNDAITARSQAAADVAQARATLTRRSLDLKYATIEAPIAGRVDQALITEGALVSPTDTTPLARVQQIDQIYVDVRLPLASAQALHHSVAISDKMPDVGPQAVILRDSGHAYPIRGQILFSGISVDAGTGDVLLRILAENNDHALLPGMFVRARIPMAKYPVALLVPQQAVTFVAGKTLVWVLDDRNMAHSVAIRTGELADNSYRVVAGLKPGQKIVVEGGERLSEGMAVIPQMWTTKTNIDTR